MNDIAILFTEDEIEFSSTVDAVELNDEPVEKGEDLYLTGWGTTSVSVEDKFLVFYERLVLL